MKKILLSFFSLMLISCSQPILNNTGQYSDLDQEYSQFKTKALTQSYLKKKLDKWLSSPVYSKSLVRELEYAKFKHKDILKNIITSDPTIFNSIIANTGVTQKRSESNFETFIESINPFTLSAVATNATNITSTSFTANWTAISGATSYKLYLDGSATPINLGNVTSYDFTSLISGSSHNYYVVSSNASGNSSNSNIINVTLNPAVPNASVATSATNITTTSFTANWGNVANASTYTLFVDGTSVYTGSNLTCNVTGLTPASSHSYYVVASNVSGNSANSNTINLTLNTVVANTPVASAATDITTTSFTANWATVTGATSYTLFIDGVSSYTGTALTYNKTGLTPASSHSYYVVASNAGGNSANSNTINLTLNTAIPNAPVSTSATDITTTSFTANWATVTGATSYTLFIDGVSSYTGTALTYNKTGLTPASSHSYYVVASNAGGNSANSNTINLTLNTEVANSPVATSATDITTTSFTANWATVTGATSYTLFIDGVSAYTGTALTYNKTALTPASSHSYYVVASNAGGNSANSNTINVSTITLAPVASAATSITTTSFTANWGTVTGATSYTLYVDSTSVYTGTATSANITALTPASSHSYYVVASNASGNSANSNTINLILNTAVPNAPVSTSATDITTTSFTANWETVTDATSYTLFIDGVSAYTGTALTYNKTGLTAGTSHTYYVLATNAGGNSANSNTINVSTIPNAPVATSATGITSSSFIANWGTVTGATSYTLYVDETSVYTGTATSANITALTAASSHSYYVIASNVGGDSANSNTINVTLNPNAPSAPVASDATEITTTSFTANWETVTDADSYKLYVDGVNVYNGTDLTYTKTGLSAATSHTYYVKAINVGGNSSNSNTINVSTITNAPVATSATGVTASSFIANWGTVTGATSYTLYVDGTSVYTGTSTSCNVTYLEINTSYTYYVVASNAGGDSANSNTINALTAPDAPVISSETNITNSSFTAHWGAVTGATGYKLYVDGINVYTGASTSCNVTGLAAGTSYTYYVTATNAGGGYSDDSDSVDVLLVPEIPIANIASDLTKTSFTANWDSSTGADNYILYVDGVPAYNGPYTDFTKTGLTAGTSHTYYVKATNDGGTSGASNTINVSTLTASPTISAVTNLKSTTFTANWGSVTGAVSYNLYLGYDLVYQGTARTFNLTGLDPDTLYDYYVEAVNATGDPSLPSNTATATTKGYLSCLVLRDTGETADGEYYINPDNNLTTDDIPVYCNMSIAGGGWTMVVAQFEGDPVKNWNEGIQADYDTSLAYQTSFALKTAELPSDRTQVAFGANLNPTYIDYGNFVYTTGTIAKTTVVGQSGSYHIHRISTGYYPKNDPENTLTAATAGNNALTFDKIGGSFYSWSFSPNQTLAARGYGLLGDWSTYDDGATAWTVWVR